MRRKPAESAAKSRDSAVPLKRRKSGPFTGRAEPRVYPRTPGDTSRISESVFQQPARGKTPGSGLLAVPVRRHAGRLHLQPEIVARLSVQLRHVVVLRDHDLALLVQELERQSHRL